MNDEPGPLSETPSSGTLVVESSMRVTYRKNKLGHVRVHGIVKKHVGHGTDNGQIMQGTW